MDGQAWGPAAWLPRAGSIRYCTDCLCLMLYARDCYPVSYLHTVHQEAKSPSYVVRRNRPHFLQTVRQFVSVHAAEARKLQACMQVKNICMTDQGYSCLEPTIVHTQYCLSCVVSLPAKEPDRSWVRLAPGLISPNRLLTLRLVRSNDGSPLEPVLCLPCCSRACWLPVLPVLRGPARQKPSTAPSVTPESRRGHPNRLAEPLAVPPWALLALLAHARRGLQLLAESLCGSRMGLLMSLVLRLRWHWTRKSGPDEGPQRSSPSMSSI